MTLTPSEAQDALRDISKALPGKTPGQQKQKGLLDYAIDRLNWEGVKNALMAYGGFSPPAAPAVVAVPVLAPPQPDVPISAVTAPALTADFLAQMARLIEYALPALGTDDDRFTEQTDVLLKAKYRRH